MARAHTRTWRPCSRSPSTLTAPAPTPPRTPPSLSTTRDRAPTRTPAPARPSPTTATAPARTPRAPSPSSNNGDGTGSYTSPSLTIINNGDGTAQVNGQKVTDAPKVDKAAKLGKFPTVESLKPVESCGTLITLEDGVLFDFGKSEIRSDASQTLKKLADVLNNAKVPSAHIYGHTDSISDEAFNQQLSEARANAVSGELKKDGVTATMDATGYGESKPVAPNENADGSDNPAGRALNRRVEIFIPAF